MSEVELLERLLRGHVPNQPTFLSVDVSSLDINVLQTNLYVSIRSETGPTMFFSSSTKPSGDVCFFSLFSKNPEDGKPRIRLYLLRFRNIRLQSPTSSTPSCRSSCPPFRQLPIPSSIMPPPFAPRRHRSWFRVGFLERMTCSISNHSRRSHLAVTDPGSCGLSSHLRPPPSFTSRRRGFSYANCLLDSLHDAGLCDGVR
ncbi:hypothetical protein Ddye_011720 [Dipteronia dyeriana]|uniref:Uncharacterized protein n=1 Tax=Dipteronia dyeriana TaxID=168575 RepID=A0AAE0CHG6_9ROSI|nr:hypothetical protein Ddye_011720 [Dipteronia dyeriana]